jgi:hypothetical protein
MSKTVRCGLLAYWFLAASPTRRSSSVKATHDGVIRLPEVIVSSGCGGGGSLQLTLIVDHDLDFSVLHDTDTRVSGSEIDTNNGAGDRVGVVLERLLALSVGRLRQHQAADEDHEEVEGN